MKSLVFIIFLFPTISFAEEVYLEWESISEAKSYELELEGETKENFLVKGSSWTKEKSPGKYFFRIRSIDQRGVPGDWSGKGEFLVRPQSVLKNNRIKKDGKVFLDWQYTENHDFFRVVVIKDGKKILNNETDNKFYELQLDPGEYKLDIQVIYKGIVSKEKYEAISIKKEEPAILRDVASQKKDTVINSSVGVKVGKRSNDYKSIYTDSYGVPFGIDFSYESLLLEINYERHFKYVTLVGDVSVEGMKIVGQDLNFFNYKLGANRMFHLKGFKIVPEAGYFKESTPEIAASFSEDYSVQEIASQNVYGGIYVAYTIGDISPGVKYVYSQSMSGSEGNSSSLEVNVEYQWNLIKVSLWMKFRELEREQSLERMQSISQEGLGLDLKFNF